MPTMEQVAREARALSTSDASIPLIVQWLNRRIAEIAAQKQLNHYRRVRELSLPAVIDDGTVTITRGSQIVAGSATGWTFDLDDGSYFFRGRTAWYKIAQVQSSTSIILESTFAEDDLSAASYRIVKRYHKLPLDTSQYDSFVHERTAEPLTILDLEELDKMDPSRWFNSGGIPNVVVEVEPAADGSRQIEIYPYAATSEILVYLAWIKPPDLGWQEQFPSFLKPHVLLEGILVDCYRYKASRETDANMTALWLNEVRRQDTKWQGMIPQAILQESGSSNAQFMVQHLNERRDRRRRDITSAYDQVWFGGSS